MSEVLTAAAVMTGLGVLFAAILAIAYRFLKVEEDPRLEVLEGMLPGNNCGACGQPGCKAFAETLLGGSGKPGQCTVSNPDNLVLIADFLGVDVGAQDKQVARLKCAGGESVVKHLAPYRGIATCQAAVLVDGGGKACNWGCLGLADCARACTFDAIRMNAESLPVVSTDACTACGDCVVACPQDLFELRPMSQKLLVQCNSPLTGEAARARCAVACDACGRCAADAEPEVIRMVNGLPVINYGLEAQPTVRSTYRCPTGAIVWLEDGQQFAEHAPEIPVRSTHG